MVRWIIIILLLSQPVFATEVTHVDNKELKVLMQQGVPVIDVRATSEWHDTGVIEGSHLLMFYDEQGKYNLDAWLMEIAQIADKNRPIALICLSGSRSHQLARYLTKVVGYEKVYNVKKGIGYWIRKNNPVVKPPK